MKVLKIPFSHKQDLPESIQEAMESSEIGEWTTVLFWNHFKSLKTILPPIFFLISSVLSYFRGNYYYPTSYLTRSKQKIDIDSHLGTPFHRSGLWKKTSTFHLNGNHPGDF